MFREWGQLCGRLTEFQEVSVILGFNSSLFALDEVATRESPFTSPLSWHWLQQGNTPWDMVRGLSPHYQSSRLLHPSLGPGLAYIPLGKGTALEDGVGERGTPEQSQRLEGVGPEGGMKYLAKAGQVRQVASHCLPKPLPTCLKGAQDEARSRRAQGS